MTDVPIRELLHEVNNFLAVCSVHSEVALEVDTRESLRRALGEILSATHEMAATVEGYRAGGVPQPETSQDTPVSPSGT